MYPGLGTSNQTEGDFKGASWEGGISFREAAGWGVRSSPGWLGLGMFCTNWGSSQLQLQVLLAQQSLVKYRLFPSVFYSQKKKNLGCFILVFTCLLEKFWFVFWIFFLNGEVFHGWGPGIWPVFLASSWVSRENRDLGESGCFWDKKGRGAGGDSTFNLPHFFVVLNYYY